MLTRALARRSAVISSPNLGVFAVTAAAFEPRRGHVIYSGVLAVTAVVTAVVSRPGPSVGLPGDLRGEHLKLADRPVRKVTWEAAATRSVPALPRPVPLPATGNLSSSRASRPERRVARGPSTGSGAPALPFSMRKPLQRARNRRRGTAPAVSREAVSEHIEIRLCVVAAETCLRRINARLPGIICRRLQITAVRRGLRVLDVPQFRHADPVIWHTVFP